jgi:hypothetical protein
MGHAFAEIKKLMNRRIARSGSGIRDFLLLKLIGI